MGWVFPTLIAGLGWQDWLGGFIYGGVLRVFVAQQTTFCVNSVAHYLGTRPYDDKLTPRDSFITNLITMGEGNHNFHHQFPSDYRNGIEWNNLDVPKWLIWMVSCFGLAGDLKRFQGNVIEQGRVQMMFKALDKRRQKVECGMPIERLPAMGWEDFLTEIQNGRHLVIIEGIIYDISDFIDEHPGGRDIIRSKIGMDGSAAFNGGVYTHSRAARNLLAGMRLATIPGGMEVEVLKR
jgi:stearoyl-CoA desaturase (delta-9 desaturase)